MDDISVSSTEFQARCLDLVNDLRERRIETVVVTENGKPVARMTGASLGVAGAGRGASIFGAMAGTIAIADGVDLLAPVIDMPANWPPFP